MIRLLLIKNLNFTLFLVEWKWGEEKGKRGGEEREGKQVHFFYQSFWFVTCEEEK